MSLKEKTKDSCKQELIDKSNVKISPVSFFKLFKFAGTRDIIYLIIGTIAACLGGLCFPVMMLFFGNLTNSFIIHAKNISNENYNERENIDILMETYHFGISVSIFAVINLMLSYTFVTLLNLASENQVYKLRNSVYHFILNQELHWFETHNSMEFVNRFTDDLNKLQDGIGEHLGMVLYYFSCCLSCIIMAVCYGWQLTLVLLVSMPVLSLASGMVAKLQTNMVQLEQEAYAQAGSLAEEVFSDIKTVKAFNGEKNEVIHFEHKLSKACQASLRRGIASGVGNGISNFIIFSSYSLAFWYGMTLINESQLAGGPYNPASLIIIFHCVLSGALNLGHIAPHMESISAARGAASAIYHIMEEKVPKGTNFLKNVYQPAKLKGNISFNNVFFCYPSRPETQVLNGLSFRVQPGEIVALVGESGCGKTTCLQLLQRFYDIQQGQILIDDVDICSYDPFLLREEMAFVSQEPVLFEESIETNIKLGNLKSLSTLEDKDIQKRIQDAVTAINGSSFIRLLPDDLKTNVGSLGSKLSGGQKQRIAIARALIKNPSILLLDEATSALDAESESIFVDYLNELKGKVTVLMAAHKASTLRCADRVILLDNGTAHEKPLDEESIKNVHDGCVAVNPEGTETYESRGLTEEDSKEKIEETNEEQSLWELVKLNRSYWPFFLLGFFFSFICGLIIPVYCILFGEILSVLSLLDSSIAQENANIISLYFFSLGIVGGISFFFQSFFTAIGSSRLIHRLRVWLFRSIINQDVTWFDFHSVGSLCTILSDDCSSIQGATGSRINAISQATATFISCIALGIWYNWKLGLICFTFMPLIIMTTFAMVKIIMSQSAVQKEALTCSVAIAMESVSNLKTVKSFCLENYFYSKFQQSLLEPHRQYIKRSHIRGFLFGISQSLPFLAYGTCMFYGGYLIRDRELSYGDLFKVLEALNYGAYMIGYSVSMASSYAKAKVGATRLLNLVKRKSATLSGEKKIDPCEGRIDFSNLVFKYPTRPATPVLRNFNINLSPPIRNLAVVGRNGSGKSTLVHLLLRHYDPTNGYIQLDNVKLPDLELKNLRSHIGVVSQEPILFNRTIKENIVYGIHSHSVPMEKVIEAARQANIHQFIQSLPLGYDTEVGSRGGQLSGGQKQRIAIARAIFKNPPILVLDEATSALDAENETSIQETLDDVQQHRVSVIISHKLKSIQQADCIVVLKNGEIIERGTHEELMVKRGEYFDMWSSQCHGIL